MNVSLKGCVLSVVGLIVSVLLAGCPASLQRPPISQQAIQTEKTKQLEMAFLLLEKRMDRLFRVYYPLQLASTEICTKDVGNLSGIIVHTKEAYDQEFREIASRLYGLDNSLRVKSVHPLSSAALSGLTSGDRILEINGRSLAGKNLSDLGDILKEQMMSTRALTLRVERGNEVHSTAFDLSSGCRYRALLAPTDIVNAISDGEAIAITTGMLKFAESDTELAFVLSHEMAHNALGHNSTSRKVGKAFLHALLGPVITQMTTSGDSKERESDADYLGLYIAARANYDISSASAFWRRMAEEHPQAIEGTFTASHPGLAERSLTIEATIKEIQHKRKMGTNLLPQQSPKN